MSDGLKTELSKKNEYWIPKERYLELKHFCLQYEQMKDRTKAFQSTASIIRINKSLDFSSPVERQVEMSNEYFERIKIIEQSVIATDPDLYQYLLIAIAKGMPYEYLRMTYNMPMSRDAYYKIYRKFFWILDKNRK